MEVIVSADKNVKFREGTREEIGYFSPSEFLRTFAATRRKTKAENHYLACTAFSRNCTISAHSRAWRAAWGSGRGSGRGWGSREAAAWRDWRAECRCRGARAFPVARPESASVESKNKQKRAFRRGYRVSSRKKKRGKNRIWFFPVDLEAPGARSRARSIRRIGEVASPPLDRPEERHCEPYRLYGTVSVNVHFHVRHRIPGKFRTRAVRAGTRGRRASRGESDRHARGKIARRESAGRQK